MDINFLILCILCVIVILKMISIIYNQYIVWNEIKSIPCEGYPYIGTTIKLMNMSDTDRTMYTLKFLDKYKEIFKMWLGGRLVISVIKPEFLEIILSSSVNIRKAFLYRLLWPWMGKGLITSSGEQWFHDRRLIGRTFHFNILEKFATVLSEKAEILIKCLEKEIKKNPGKAIDILPFANNVTLDIICETAMGVNVHAQEEKKTQYVSIVSRTTKITNDRIIKPWYWIDWIFYKTPLGKEYKSLIDTLHEFTNKVIRRKKAERKSQSARSESENNQFDSDERRTKAFLDTLLDENEKADTPITDDELRAQVDTFMFAGHDTTATALIWALFLLGHNLDHQEKVHEELDQVFKNSKMPATVKELSQLKYLDRVMKESSRLYPSVPIIGRELVEDVKIGSSILRKGTTMMLSIILAHRNPDVWPDPEKFDPDRFLPENSQHRHPYAYIPFSAGPRNCIGQRFAQLEEKIILTAIFRKWRVKSIKSSSEMSFYLAFITRPGEPVFLQFIPK